MDQQIIYDEELPEMHEHMIHLELPLSAPGSVKMVQDARKLSVTKVAASTVKATAQPQPSNNLHDTGDDTISQADHEIPEFDEPTVASVAAPSVPVKKRKTNTSANVAAKKTAKKKSIANKEQNTADNQDGMENEEVPCRFTSAMDLELLREISVSKPFIGSFKDVAANWKKSYQNLKWKKFSVLAIQRRFDLLKKKFLSQENASLKSSGTEEECDEKITLLTDIMEAYNSAEQDKKDKSAEEEQKAAKCEAVRLAALEGMSSTKGKDKKVDMSAVFEKKISNEHSRMEKQLEFDKEKFQKKIEQQEKDRAERAEDRALEQRRIAIQEESLKLQQAMTLELVKSLTNKN